MKIRGTDFVMYQVSDLARAARFYRETLGLAQEVYSEEWQWAEFNCGNVTLALHGGVSAKSERLADYPDPLVVHPAIPEMNATGLGSAPQRQTNPTGPSLRLYDQTSEARPESPILRLRPFA